MYNSQYYTCEQVDQRLLQGYLDDYNSENNTSLTKSQFLSLLATHLNSGLTTSNIVQESGNNTNKLMSQAIVTQLLSNLQSNINNLRSNTNARDGYYQATISDGTITVNAPNYLLETGGNFHIKMPSAGTTASTLTIGNANEVPLWYNGAAVSAQNTWEKDEIISVFYDGTRFMASNSQGGGGNGKKKLTGTSGFISTANVDTQGAVPTPSPNGNYVYIKYGVDKGDVLLLTAKGSNTVNGRIWAFADEHGNYTEGAEISDIAENMLLIVPDGVKWVILNNNINTCPEYKWYYAKADSTGVDALLALRAQYTLYDNTKSISGSENVQDVLTELSKNTSKYINSGYDFTNKRIHNVGALVEQEEGTRFSIGINVKAGTKIRCQCDYGSGVLVALWESFSGGCIGGTYLIQNISGSHTKDEVFGVCNSDGVLCLRFAKENGTSLITAEDIDDILTALDVEVFMEEISSQNLEERISFTEDFNKTRVHKIYTQKDCEIAFAATDEQIDEFNSRTRYKLIKEVPANTIVTAFCDYADGLGVNIGFYPDRESALRQVSAASIISPRGMQFDRTISFVTPCRGWVGAQIQLKLDKKGKEVIYSYITLHKNLQHLTFTMECDDYVTNVEEVRNFNNFKELYIGEVIQGTVYLSGGYWLVATDTHNTGNLDSKVLARDVLSVPYDGVKILFKLPKDMAVQVFTGVYSPQITDRLANDKDAPVINNFFTDGDTVTLNKNHYRLLFQRYGGDREALVQKQSLGSFYLLTPEEVTEMIDNGDIKLYYEDRDKDNVVERNHEAEKILKSLQHTGNEVKSGGSGIINLDNLPKIVHTSDVHSDAYRLNNVYDFADFIDANYVVVTGDVVGRIGGDYCRFLYDIDNKHKTETLLSLGNHDCAVAAVADMPNRLYNVYIKDLHEKYDNYNCPYIEETIDEETVNKYKPYYYVDDTVHGLRIISLCIHELGCGLNNTTHMVTNHNNAITEHQINWFIATLASTPAGYGVIVHYHDPEKKITNTINNKFMQSGLTTSDYKIWLNWEAMTFTNGIMPITNIINGFIRHESGSGSYKNGNSALINYSFDFSELTTQKFICHLCGHEHSDAVGYYVGFDGSVEGKSKQVAIVVPCTQALYEANGAAASDLTDLPRGGVGVTQDCFNCYVIDKENELIHIVRIGSNLAYGQRSRDYMSISYSQD